MTKQDWSKAPADAQFYSYGLFRKHDESGAECYYWGENWHRAGFTENMNTHKKRIDFEMRPTDQKRNHPAAACQYNDSLAPHSEWPASDERIDAIGQNGGGGEHYDSTGDLAATMKQQEASATLSELYPQYYKDCRHIDNIDVYGVHDLFGIQDESGCLQHASKKILLSGKRNGGKSLYQDIKEARDTLNRKLQLMEAGK